MVNLGAALKARLAPGSECRAEAATAAVPKGKSETNARIPDVVILHSMNVELPLSEVYASIFDPGIGQ